MFLLSCGACSMRCCRFDCRSMDFSVFFFYLGMATGSAMSAWIICMAGRTDVQLVLCAEANILRFPHVQIPIRTKHQSASNRYAYIYSRTQHNFLILRMYQNYVTLHNAQREICKCGVLNVVSILLFLSLSLELIRTTWKVFFVLFFSPKYKKKMFDTFIDIR